MIYVKYVVLHYYYFENFLYTYFMVVCLFQLTMSGIFFTLISCTLISWLYVFCIV